MADALVEGTLGPWCATHPGAAPRVLDPACGDGELLLAAKRWLEGRGLAGQLLGLDVDPDAIEAARSRLPGAVLQVGNALVTGALDASLSEAERERIAPFDLDGWGPFDAVIANPPYVKRSWLQRAEPKVARWLVEGIQPPLRSLSERSADLSLAFIERGLRLLRPGGRMGFIAPSLWTRLRGGAGLRALLREQRALVGWVDFGAAQVFGTATTYTALQFFEAGGDGVAAGAGVACRFAAPHEAGEAVRALDGTLRIDWEALPAGGPWYLLPADERAELARLLRVGTPLGERVERAGLRGVETGADRLFHFARLGPGRYRSRDGDEVALEDRWMRPLADGRTVGPWRSPGEDGPWLLTPYDDALVTLAELERRAPEVAAWLRSHEQALRARLRGRMDRDDRWWGFTSASNLPEHRRPKLLVPRLVHRLAAAVDLEGRFVLDNVDVGGVLVAGDDPDELRFLAAVLNSEPANRAFRWLSKPFAGDYRSAEKQFLARVPLPPATAEERRGIAALVERGRFDEAGRRAGALYWGA
jgi:adenine-specific DNA-methyltransferase